MLRFAQHDTRKDWLHCQSCSFPKSHGSGVRLASDTYLLLLLLLAVALLTLSACTLQGPGARGQGLEGSVSLAPTPDPRTPTPRSRSRIVETTTGWPRMVEDASGRVTIPSKPMRIHTLSVGYDEIT